MSQIVHVRHPVPLRYLPKGGRHERIVFDQATTPVRLREAARDAFKPVTYIRSGDLNVYFYAHQGGLWTELRQRKSSTEAETRVPAEDLLGWFVGDLTSWHIATSDIRRHFYRTPLLAADLDRETWKRQGERGQVFDRSDLHRLVEDLTDPCRQAVQRLLQDEVALVDGGVFVRSPGPLLDERRNLMLHPRMDWRHNLACRIDRIEDLEEALGFGDSREDQQRDFVCGSIDPALLRDDDVALFVNNAPHALLDLSRRYLVGGGDAREDRLADLRGMAARLMPWHARGLVGAVAPEDHPRVLEQVVGFVDALRDFSRKAAGDEQLRSLRVFARDVALPRLRAGAAMEDDDAHALSDIGGGFRP